MYFMIDIVILLLTIIIELIILCIDGVVYGSDGARHRAGLGWQWVMCLWWGLRQGWARSRVGSDLQPSISPFVHLNRRKRKI